MWRGRRCRGRSNCRGLFRGLGRLGSLFLSWLKRGGLAEVIRQLKIRGTCTKIWQHLRFSGLQSAAVQPIRKKRSRPWARRRPGENKPAIVPRLGRDRLTIRVTEYSRPNTRRQILKGRGQKAREVPARWWNELRKRASMAKKR